MKKFKNYLANLAVLQKAGDEDLSNEFILSGIIDKFYIQFELSWKVLKELLKYEGRAEAQSDSPAKSSKLLLRHTILSKKNSGWLCCGNATIPPIYTMPVQLWN